MVLSDEEAAKIAAAVAERLRAPLGTGITVGRLYLRFRASRPPGRAWRLVRGLLRPFVVRFWRAAVSSLRLNDWEDHLATRARTKTRLGRYPSRGTLSLEQMRTRQMFAYGVTAGLCDKNPLAGARSLGRRRRRETVLTERQLEALIAGCGRLKWDRQRVLLRAFVLVKGFSGLRMQEVLGLREDRLTVEGTYVLWSSETKTKRSRTTAFVARALGALRDLQRLHGQPRFFTNPKTGRLFSASGIRKLLRQVVEKTGLEAVVAEGDFRFQARDIRATFATIALAKGAPVRAIQHALGHQSLATTEIYLRDKPTAADALEMAGLMESRKPPRRSPIDPIQLRAMPHSKIVRENS